MFLGGTEEDFEEGLDEVSEDQTEGLPSKTRKRRVGRPKKTLKSKKRDFRANLLLKQVDKEVCASPQDRLFSECFQKHGNATRAAREAGYSSPSPTGMGVLAQRIKTRCVKSGLITEEGFFGDLPENQITQGEVVKNLKKVFSAALKSKQFKVAHDVMVSLGRVAGALGEKAQKNSVLVASSQETMTAEDKEDFLNAAKALGTNLPDNIFEFPKKAL